MWNAPRIGISAAVCKVERAGIRLFLITGDHPTTAEALAHQIGFPATNSDNELQHLSTTAKDAESGAVESSAKSNPIGEEEELHEVRSAASSGQQLFLELLKIHTPAGFSVDLSALITLIYLFQTSS
jgi:magnesium-transporting ATPase (P-type)